ncbi:MAG: hypothetical protein HWE30_08495 [Methylocystaceae bacterium]|nr:hypothetical protein [Methylocystaceae bacterium]
MSLPENLKKEFDGLACQRDEGFDSTKAAFLLSKALKPSKKIEQYAEKLELIATNCADQVKHADRFDQKIKKYSHFLVESEGFHGDEEAYDDLDHMNLFSILDTKCGTAMGLSLIYLHCAQKCALQAEALNFPGHSLICLQEGAERIIIDPFAKAVQLDAHDLRQFLKVIGGADVELNPKFYQGLSPKTLFMRHLNAVKAHFLRCMQMEKALEMLQVLTALQPKSATYWRETGLLQARVGFMSEAANSLKTALKYTTDPETIRHTQHIIDDIEKKPN